MASVHHRWVLLDWSASLAAVKSGLLALRRRLFEPHDAEVVDSTIVEQFEALGDPVRWAIGRKLRVGTSRASELSDVTEVSPPLVLRHIGLIAGTKRGRWVDHTVDTDARAESFARIEPEIVTS